MAQIQILHSKNCRGFGILSRYRNWAAKDYDSRTKGASRRRAQSINNTIMVVVVPPSSAAALKLVKQLNNLNSPLLEPRRQAKFDSGQTPTFDFVP